MTKTDARAEALQTLGAAFRGLNGAVRRLRGRETHNPGELSFAQFHLLFGLAEHDGLSTSQLAAVAELTPATATQMLDGLEAMGLVSRARAANDRRVVTCSLTDSGRKLVTEKRKGWERRWRQALSEFSGEELATSAAVLERLRTMFDELDHEGSTAKTPR